MFRPAEKGDFGRIEMEQTPELLIMRKRLYEPGMTEQIERWTRTMEVEGRVLAIYGGTPVWDGVVQVWSFLSPEALSRYVALTREIVRCLKVLDEMGIRRISSEVEDGHLASHKWHKFLGFEVEGYMKNYGLGGEGSYYLYARTR